MLAEQKIASCIPPKKNRKETIECCKTTYKTKHKVENLFAKLKDWRHIATRYDRCAHTFRSAIYLAATIILWLCALTPSGTRKKFSRGKLRFIVRSGRRRNAGQRPPRRSISRPRGASVKQSPYLDAANMAKAL